jgi:hypothetical protein
MGEHLRHWCQSAVSNEERSTVSMKKSSARHSLQADQSAQRREGKNEVQARSFIQTRLLIIYTGEVCISTGRMDRAAHRHTSDKPCIRERGSCEKSQKGIVEAQTSGDGAIPHCGEDPLVGWRGISRISHHVEASRRATKLKGVLEGRRNHRRCDSSRRPARSRL